MGSCMASTNHSRTFARRASSLEELESYRGSRVFPSPERVVFRPCAGMREPSKADAPRGKPPWSPPPFAFLDLNHGEDRHIPEPEEGLSIQVTQWERPMPMPPLQKLPLVAGGLPLVAAQAAQHSGHLELTPLSPNGVTSRRKDGETTRTLLLVAWKLLRELLSQEASKPPTSPRFSSGEETGEKAKSP